MNIDLMQLKFIDLNLREIATEIETITGLKFTVTSLYRMNDSGVHGTLPLRGIDLRMRDHIIGKQIQNIINSKWDYNPGSGKQCAFLHGEGSNLHLHLQTHPSTRRK